MRLVSITIATTIVKVGWGTLDKLLILGKPIGHLAAVPINNSIVTEVGLRRVSPKGHSENVFPLLFPWAKKKSSHHFLPCVENFATHKVILCFWVVKYTNKTPRVGIKIRTFNSCEKYVLFCWEKMQISNSNAMEGWIGHKEAHPT
jgi:hypothetical protein